MSKLTLQTKLRRIKFSISPTGAGRIHYLTPEDVRILLSRLPEKLWERLKTVYFNDQSRGRRYGGYVTRARRDIAICALAGSLSCTPFDSRKQRVSPRMFGAKRGAKWPRLAIRRFMLYDIFLHELGHLQIIDPEAKSSRRKFASETLAQKFANEWRRKLWSKHFDHPDPVHNPPSPEEFVDPAEGDPQSSD